MLQLEEKAGRNRGLQVALTCVPAAFLLLALFMMVTHQYTGAIVGTLLSVSCLVLPVLAGRRVELTVDERELKLLWKLPGYTVVHRCPRDDVEAIRVRRIPPSISLLEFVSRDGRILLNTTTDWLTMKDLDDLSSCLGKPVDNVAAALVSAA